MNNSVARTKHDPMERADGMKPPGPRGSFFLGILPEARRDLLGLFERCRREHGDVVKLPTPVHDFYLVSSDTGVRRIFVENVDNYPKSQIDKELFGRGLVRSEGALWKRQHKLYEPAFKKSAVPTFGPPMLAAIEALCSSWDERPSDEAPIDVAEEMSRLTLDVMGRALWGRSVLNEADHLGELLDAIFDYIVWKAKHPLSLPKWVPTGRNRTLKSATSQLHAFVQQIIDESRSSPQPGTLLHTFINAGMEPDILRDEVVTTLVAGHETTGNALTWTLYLLAQYPDCHRKLCAEIEAAVGSGPVTVESLAKLPYLLMICNESLRLYPPGYYSERVVKQDDVIDGYKIRAGSKVVISSYVVHRHERYWPNPMAFDPERWLPAVAAKRPRYAYLPFGAGARQCTGLQFALQEMMLAIGLLAQRYQFSLVDHFVIPEASMDLKPLGGLNMTIKPLAARMAAQASPSQSPQEPASSALRCPVHHEAS
jgi:cytochrome P450